MIPEIWASRSFTAASLSSAACRSAATLASSSRRACGSSVDVAPVYCEKFAALRFAMATCSVTGRSSTTCTATVFPAGTSTRIRYTVSVVSVTIARVVASGSKSGTRGCSRTIVRGSWAAPSIV